MRLLLSLMSITEHDEQERTDFDLEPLALPLPGSIARRSYFTTLWLVRSPTEAAVASKAALKVRAQHARAESTVWAQRPHEDLI